MSDASILAQVQAAPDVFTNDPDFVDSLISSGKDFVAAKANLPVYPTASAQGYSKSGLAPSVDFSALSAVRLLVSMDGSPLIPVSASPASCTTGSATAAAIQAAIRAAGDGLDYHRASFELATFVYDSSDAGAEFYQLTSPSFGAASRAFIGHEYASYEFAAAAKLGQRFGGVEVGGVEHVEALDRAVAILVINGYRKTKLLPQAYERGANFIVAKAFQEVDEQVMQLICSSRGFGLRHLDPPVYNSGYAQIYPGSL